MEGIPITWRDVLCAIIVGVVFALLLIAFI